MNDLEKYFGANTGNLINKWQHYFEIYDRHFARFRGTQVNVLEFGVAHGGSLLMWKDYFGAQARIFGVDNNPHCKSLECDRVEITIGDQADREFLRGLSAQLPRIDILIDDGGHTMQQQITTFEEMYARVDAHGVYLCEDLHTSYWPDWGGGYGNSDTFIEFSKRLIDQLNAWHSIDAQRMPVTELTRSAHALHFYDSVLVVEKRPGEKPSNVKTGVPQIPTAPAPRNFPKPY